MQSPQAVMEDSNARFLCTVSGSPRPTVKWLKGTETVAVCVGKQHGSCRITATEGSKYKSYWRDERTCMVQHSNGPTSGRWSSWLNVLRTRSPADAVNYTCVVDNDSGEPDKRVSLLAIIGKFKGRSGWGLVQPGWESVQILTLNKSIFSLNLHWWSQSF